MKDGVGMLELSIADKTVKLNNFSWNFREEPNYFCPTSWQLLRSLSSTKSRDRLRTCLCSGRWQRPLSRVLIGLLVTLHSSVLGYCADAEAVLWVHIPSRHLQKIRIPVWKSSQRLKARACSLWTIAASSHARSWWFRMT